ncbi:MAG: exosome complex RNA-binding protein Rrp4 [Candidatus Hydrothermarchaeales archaeon]
MRRLVLPGEFITDKRPRLGPGVTTEENGVHSSILGLLDEKENYIRIIPLAGGYNPKEEDFVIGVVSDVQGTYWRLDIASPYSAILPAGEYIRELRGNERLKEILSFGSSVYVKIKEVTKTKGVFTTLKWRGTKILKEGFLIEVSPSKIPRIIGKKDSMIRILKEETGCDILAGQNGVVWIDGPGERMDLAVEAVRYIANNSHKSGLTDYVKKMIIEKRNSL